MAKKAAFFTILAVILFAFTWARGYRARGAGLAQTNAAAPATTPQVNYEVWFNQTIQDGYFGFNKANLRPNTRQILASDAAALRAHPNIKFLIEGDCDERGSEQYNQQLGQRRASAAETFLANHGISAARIKAVSYGKDRPVCTAHDPACWQKNQRVHLAFETAGN
ncbi:MAG: OmpA family protein [Terriglobia bacterium]